MAQSPSPHWIQSRNKWKKGWERKNESEINHALMPLSSLLITLQKLGWRIDITSIFFPHITLLIFLAVENSKNKQKSCECNMSTLSGLACVDCWSVMSCRGIWKIFWIFFISKFHFLFYFFSSSYVRRSRVMSTHCCSCFRCSCKEKATHESTHNSSSLKAWRNVRRNCRTWWETGNKSSAIMKKKKKKTFTRQAQ